MGFERERPRPESKRPPDYDQKFDFRTLAYDVFLDDETGLVQLYCPKLYNLEGVFKKTRLEADGHPAEVQAIRRLKRHDVVSIQAPAEAESLSILAKDWQVSVPIQKQELGPFEGKNCLLTLSKDNALPWIQDWAAYHVKEHGAQALLLFDNG